ncbi:MAG TPA: outer membrane beta-barrel protein [bacterium]|nr:outer membrane beta-barrel protein [bacterium]HOG43581.1 outer membrane beta-barrel protein [bacterium]HPY14765.1 outer membrane beta-barrel protein [bacterium]HQB10273.1 outer membrane beta-barrel protein [bacterium]HQM84052.1 outer membrane beta-barrel protein [bacterium]
MRPLLLSAVFIAILVFSVNLSASDFYAGAKIGPGAAFGYGDDADDLDFDPAAGMSFGLFGTYVPIKFLAVQAELNYELKGFSKNSNAEEMEITIIGRGRQYLHYFSIPLIVKGDFIVSRFNIQPYFGLNFSFLMSAKIHIEYEISIWGDGERDNTNTDDYEVFDLGILFGTEAFIKITDHIFVTADLRFDLGVLEIIDDAEMFNGTFLALFGAAYRF